MKSESEIFAERLIGSILVRAGKLPAKAITEILAQQKITNLRFGEAAIQLGLIADEDVQYALAQQYGYSYLLAENQSISHELVAAYDPYSEQVEAMRTIRAQLMQKRFTGQVSKKCLAIVSPASGEGKSYMAANLAIVFSQLGKRTLLIDADMRAPVQHELFKLDNRSGLSSILAERSEAYAQIVNGFTNLSVLTAGAIPPNPQELIARPLFNQLLKSLITEFDVILIDTPASSEFADSGILSDRAGAVLTIVRRNHTRVEQLRQHLNSIEVTGAETMGVIFNEY